MKPIDCPFKPNRRMLSGFKMMHLTPGHIYAVDHVMQSNDIQTKSPVVRELFDMYSTIQFVPNMVKEKLR